MNHRVKYIGSHIFVTVQEVFTVSVGNLPPGAMVVIKITYVTELQVDGDLINFRLPGSVAPWKQKYVDAPEFKDKVSDSI